MPSNIPSFFADEVHRSNTAPVCWNQKLSRFKRIDLHANISLASTTLFPFKNEAGSVQSAWSNQRQEIQLILYTLVTALSAGELNTRLSLNLSAAQFYPVRGRFTVCLEREGLWNNLGPPTFHGEWLADSHTGSMKRLRKKCSFSPGPWFYPWRTSLFLPDRALCKLRSVRNFK